MSGFTIPQRISWCCASWWIYRTTLGKPSASRESCLLRLVVAGEIFVVEDGGNSVGGAGDTGGVGGVGGCRLCATLLRG